MRFRTVARTWINNIEVTHALRRFPLAQYALHQDAGGALRLQLAGRAPQQAEVVAALRALFRAEQPLAIEEGADFGGKVVQYTSALPGNAP